VEVKAFFGDLGEGEEAENTPSVSTNNASLPTGIHSLNNRSKICCLGHVGSTAIA